MARPEHIAPESDGAALYYKELSANNARPTIMLLHGAHSSGNEWDVIAPQLGDKYHLILPDLPGHGNSQHVSPFSKQLSARLLASLIRARAIGGKAHLVGHSMGAQVAIELASQYPDVVDTVMISGYGVMTSPRALAYGLWIQNSAASALPTSVVRWLTDGADIQLSGSNSLALSKEIAASSCFGDDGWPVPWPARTLIIAAGKSGILPTADSAADAKRLRDIGRQKNEATVAYTHPNMRHPWNRQSPNLYVKTAVQWFEEGTVSEGFKIL